MTAPLACAVCFVDGTDPPRVREGAYQIQDQARPEQARPVVQILRRHDPDHVEADHGPPGGDPLQQVRGLEVGEASKGRSFDAGSDPRIEDGDIEADVVARRLGIRRRIVGTPTS